MVFLILWFSIISSHDQKTSRAVEYRL